MRADHCEHRRRGSASRCGNGRDLASALRPASAAEASGSRSAREDEQRDGRDEDDGQRDRADNVAEARLHLMLRDREWAGWLTSSSYRAGGSLGSIRLLYRT